MGTEGMERDGHLVIGVMERDGHMVKGVMGRGEVAMAIETGLETGIGSGIGREITEMMEASRGEAASIQFARIDLAEIHGLYEAQ